MVAELAENKKITQEAKVEKLAGFGPGFSDICPGCKAYGSASGIHFDAWIGRNIKNIS